MLVLSRKLDEVIRIGNDVEITVLAVKGNTVRIGIKAPREVKVLRAELPVNPTQATITAIVDSPTAADQQVFVGKVRATEAGPAVSLHSSEGAKHVADSGLVAGVDHGADPEQGIDQAAVRLAKGPAPVRGGSLSAYLRDHHTSTAV